MDNGLEMEFFGRDQRKTFIKFVAGLVAEDGESSRFGAILSEDSPFPKYIAWYQDTASWQGQKKHFSCVLPETSSLQW